MSDKMTWGLRILAGLLFVGLAFAVVDANATDKTDKPPKEVNVRNIGEIDNSVTNTSESLSDAQASADAQAAAGAEASATGGSNGDQISVNSSQFYALSLTHPNAVNCFVGAQGGASDTDMKGGTSGFLGIHYLNKSCWMEQLASQERDIELNARLKCHDKHYRNAIAFDVPKGKNKNERKRQQCIDMVVASGQALMNEHKADLSRLIQQQDLAQQRLEVCNDRVDDANERTARCVEAATLK